MAMMTEKIGSLILALIVIMFIIAFISSQLGVDSPLIAKFMELLGSRGAP